MSTLASLVALRTDQPPSHPRDLWTHSSLCLQPLIPDIYGAYSLLPSCLYSNIVFLLMLSMTSLFFLNSYHFCAFFFFFFYKFLHIYLFMSREQGREEEREGEKHWCERETLIGCLLNEYCLGIEPTTQACALTGNQTTDLCGMSPNQLSQTSQGHDLLIQNLSVPSLFYLFSQLLSPSHTDIILPVTCLPTSEYKLYMDWDFYLF